MSISILLGKPGSGKSYHATRKIAQVLCSWARKSSTDACIVTNLSLNLENLEAYVSRYTGVSDFVASHVKLVDDSFLMFDRSQLLPTDIKQEKRGFRVYEVVDPSSAAYFWNRLPDGAFVVLDEFQKYVGSIKEYGESENQSLTNYFTQHRHHRHEWIIITQAMTSINVTVRKCAQTVYEVFNAKNAYIGFPISIPLKDVETLLKGFGVERQVYRVREGTLDGSYRVYWEGGVQVVAMSQEIFALYSTHTLLEKNTEETASLSDSSDSELPFELGPGSRWRAVKWFLSVHAWHLSLKLAVVLFLFFICFRVAAFLKDPESFKLFSSALASSSSGLVSGSSSGSSSKSMKESVEYPEPVDIVVNGQENNLELVETSQALSFVMVCEEFVVGVDGREYRVGDQIGEERIIKASPRYGVELEPLGLEYDRILRQSELYRRFFDRIIYQKQKDSQEKYD